MAVETQASQEQEKSYAGSKLRRQETQSLYDRLWLTDPEQFNPLRNIMERTRLERTLRLVQDNVDLKGKKVADLGCGSGALDRMLRDAGAHVDAVDISSIALKKLEEQGAEALTPIQGYVPMTLLKDDAYDLVVCTELIGELQEDEYRLLFSELARIVKSDGFVVCSTSLDIHSMDALQRFGTLAETELQVDHWVLSYHRLWIRLKDFFSAPARFDRASGDPEWRKRQIDQRHGFDEWWFKVNSTPVPAFFWRLIKLLFIPFVALIKNSKGLLLLLERFSSLFFGEEGISQAILIGKRRALFLELPANEIPKERKKKHQVWE